MYIESPYLTEVLGTKLTTFVTMTTKRIIKSKVKFDAIAFRGMSGAIIACPVASIFKKPLIIVRKSIKNCHSSRQVEGFIDAKKYIIVDDFIETGKTIRN